MAAAFGDFAVGNGNNAVGSPDCAKAMSDNQRRSAVIGIKTG